MAPNTGQVSETALRQRHPGQRQPHGDGRVGVPGADVGPLLVGRLVHEELRGGRAPFSAAVQVDHDEVLGLDEPLVEPAWRDQHPVLAHAHRDVAVAGGDEALAVHPVADLDEVASEIAFTLGVTHGAP